MYLTCVGAAVNPMKFRLEDEKEVAEKKKEHKQIHIEPKNFFGICVVVSLVLLLAVVPYYGYLKMGVHKLQKERSEKQYLADEYKEYNQAKTEYEKIENLYQETTTTSEGIGDFIDELEKNMPSDILVRSITSNSESVTMDIRVSSKREAAKVVDELSDFESISDVQVESLEETKSETNQSYVDFMVVCTYVGGTADGDAQNETTMSEDVEALETKQQGSDRRRIEVRRGNPMKKDRKIKSAGMSDRDKNLLFIVGGILLVVLVIQFGFRNFLAENKEQKATKAALEAELKELDVIQKNEKEYTAQTEEWKKKQKNIIKNFRLW